MKTKLGIVAMLMAVMMVGAVNAASWDVDVATNDLVGNSKGGFNNGTYQWGLDTTGADSWYHNEVAKLSTKATWTGSGLAQETVNYVVPGVAGEAKFGEATIGNMVQTANAGNTATFNTNYATNFAGASNGGGAYPAGNFNWAGYGTKLEATGNYQMATAIYETTNEAANNHFDYYLTGAGSGKINYGASSFSAGANWGDGEGSVALNKWEYNSAEATGAGQFVENLGGDNSLQNARYTLPGGGNVNAVVNFNNGMVALPIWMNAN
jgi:hypothetical protein